LLIRRKAAVTPGSALKVCSVPSELRTGSANVAPISKNTAVTAVEFFALLLLVAFFMTALPSTALHHAAFSRTTEALAHRWRILKR
jgi:hypothetical protein